MLQNQIKRDEPIVIFSASDCDILVGELAKLLRGNGIDSGRKPMQRIKRKKTVSNSDSRQLVNT